MYFVMEVGWTFWNILRVVDRLCLFKWNTVIRVAETSAKLKYTDNADIQTMIVYAVIDSLGGDEIT